MVSGSDRSSSSSSSGSGDRSSNNDSPSSVVSILVPLTTTLTLSTILYYTNRFRRSRWTTEEERNHGGSFVETTHSVIDHFKSLVLDPETSVDEANKKRTTSYYLKMRESHSKSLVLGISPLSKLIQLRNKEMDRTLYHWKRGDQSHRTIVVMCDDYTRSVLKEARRMILEPLEYSSDIETRGVWIPPLNMIPDEGELICDA